MSSTSDDLPVRICRLSQPLQTAQLFLQARCSYRVQVGDEVRTFPTLLRWQESWWRWQGTHWNELSREALSAELLPFMVASLEHKDAKRVGPKHVQDVMKLLADLVQAPRLKVGDYTDGASGRGLLSCANGTLDAATGELYDHTPELFNVSALDVAYDPAATCPAWLEFLGQVYPGSPDKVALLQEWVGYNLTDDTDQQKIMLMVGAKRGGKGTIARIMSELVGPKALSSPTLDSLASNFGLQPLIGRKVAIVGDARLSGGRHSNYQATIERLLTISGENELNVDRKFMSPWTGQLNARFTIITNMLPGLRDDGGALASRMLVLTHSVSFLGREDTGLTARLRGELPGILAWAVEGYRRLRQRGHFTVLEGERSMTERLERTSSPMKAFLHDCCVLDKDAFVEKDRLHLAYLDWCTGEGIDRPVHDKARFGEQLYAAADHAITETKPRQADGRRLRAYKGLRLMTDAERMAG